MKWIIRNCIFFTMLLIWCTSSFSAKTYTLYGFEKAREFKNHKQGKYYIQAGGFLSKTRAKEYKHLLQTKINYPIKIVKKAKFNMVIVGPLKASAVRKVANDVLPPITVVAKQNYHALSQSNTIQPVQINPIAEKPQPFVPVIHTAQSNWFVSLGLGGERPQFESTMSVNNGSNFPAPYNQDLYSVGTKTGLIVDAAIGHRWEREATWISAYSLGLSYQNIAAINAGGTVMQYSDPTFTNYNYNSYISSNVLLAFAKINLFQYRAVSPFIKGGVGCAFNRSSDYSETALANVTPRENPAFASETTSQLAYKVGAGVDVQLNKQVIISLDYAYLHLGNVSSGTGAALWSGQSLNLGSYRSNEMLLSVNYLFER
jgi:opacity protein-like surface antigen